MGPLSGKQQREYAKFAAKEQRESAKAESEESRKQELHEIKLQEAAAKANQQLGHKEDAHSAKMSESGGPLSRKYSVGTIEVIPVNYMKQGGGSHLTEGHAQGGSAGNPHPVMPSDTVPAMLTPGEAVIPKEAAQIPANKEIIQRMVNQGREIQGHATGTINVRDNMPSLPIIGVKRRGVKGYAGGGEVKASPSIAGRMWDTFIHHGFKSATPSAPVVPEVVAKPVPRVITINGQDVVVGGPQPVVPQVVQTNDQAQILRGLDGLMPGMQAASKGVRPDTRGYAGGAVEVDGSDNRFSRQGTPEPVPPTFDVWKQAIYGQESGNGSVDTSKPNYAGAYGKGQIIKPTFDSLQKQGRIPADFDINNPAHNEQAAEIVMGDAWKAAKGDPRLASAYYYGGPKAIAGGQIVPYKDLKNSKAPNTLQYADQVGARMTPPTAISVPPSVPVISAPNPRIAELYKVLNGPYPANDKGKARMELQELTGTSKQGAYKAIEQGTIKPDGTYVVPPVSGMSAEDTQRVLNGGVPPGTITTLDQYNASKKKLNPNFVPGPQVDVLQRDTVPNQPLPDTGAGAGRGSQGIVSPTNPDSEQMIADMGRSNQDVLSSPPPEATTPEEKKAWYEDVLHNIYGGPDSMFNQKDLIRFVGGAAFRMATGDTVNNALRAASGDVLNQSDKRHAVEQTEKMAQNRLDAGEEKALRNSLLSQQYSPERVEAYLKAKKASEQKGGKEIDPNILGDAKTTTRKVGKPEQYTFSSGPLMGQQFPAQKHEIMTGKRKGDEVWTVNGIPVEDFAGVMAASNPANKHAIGSAQFVPYSDGEHGIRARTARYDAFESKINDSVTDIYKTSLGTQDVKGKPGNWENLPPPTKVANQTRMFFESRGDYNPDDPQQRTQLNAVTQNAISKMIDMNRDSKTKVQDITPYLAQEIILGTSGVNKGAFMVGNTPMAAGKIATMDDNLRYIVRKDNPKANASELEQLKAKKLRDLYFQYNQEKPIMGSDKESGFYQYVTSKLK